MAVYGPIRHKKKYYMDRRKLNFGPYNIFLVTDRSIYCHMTLRAMNYLLYICGRVFQVRLFSSYCFFTIQGLVQQNEKKPVRSFSFTFRYMQHVISQNNSKFSDYVDRIHSIELQIKDTTDTAGSASYLDLYIEIDIEGWLRTKLYDNREHFNFLIVNFSFICCSLPAAPVCGVYISLLIQYLQTNLTSQKLVFLFPLSIQRIT
jgi:hypothetical protein